MQKERVFSLSESDATVYPLSLYPQLLRSDRSLFRFEALLVAGDTNTAAVTKVIGMVL
jgi:hypothetical protein